MNRVVLVTRHAQSCNNAAQPLEKFKEPLLTRYGVTSAIKRSLLKKFDDEGNLTDDYLYNSDIVYVSCLVRTWLTALILYNANQETPKPVFTLRVIPDLKEEHGVAFKIGNYPLELKVSLSLFITFLNNLNSLQEPEAAAQASAAPTGPGIRELIDKLPTRIKIEIYGSDTSSEPLEITFKKNVAPEPEPEPEPEPDLDLEPEPDGHLYSVDCDSTISALENFHSDPLTGDEGHTGGAARKGNIQETVKRLNQGNYKSLRLIEWDNEKHGRGSNVKLKSDERRTGFAMMEADKDGEIQIRFNENSATSGYIKTDKVWVVADDIIHVVSHNEIMRECLRRFHVDTYKIKELQPAVAAATAVTNAAQRGELNAEQLAAVEDNLKDAPLTAQMVAQGRLKHLQVLDPAKVDSYEKALGLVTLYENKTAGDVSEPTLGAIEELKDGNMFSIEFKFSAPATTPKLSKIYKGVEFTGDKSRQYTDSIEAGLCIYEKSPSYLPIHLNCEHYQGPYKAKLIKNFRPDKDVLVYLGGVADMTVYESIHGEPKSEALFTRQISSSTEIRALNRDEGKADVAVTGLRVADSSGTMEEIKLIFDNPDDRSKVYSILTQRKHAAASRPSANGGGMLKKKRKSKHKSKPKSKRKSKRKRKSKPKRKSKRKTRKR